MKSTTIEFRIEEVKKLVDDACIAVSTAVRENRRKKKTAPYRVLRMLEKQFQRPLTEYIAHGQPTSIKEARNLVRKAISTARGNR